MSFFNQYPYININDLNLDFILNAIKEMRNEVTNFVSINAIKYADPIQWNITSQYEKNTIVIDPQTGTAYISVAPVPSGVALTRDEYWTVVFDLGSFVTRAAKNFTTRYEQDTTTTATFNSVTGDWLVWGDTLYVANVNITAGDSYVVDGNIRRITVEEVKNTIVQLIADNYDAIVAMIGDLDDLDTTAKNNVVAAINELVTADASLSDRIDDEVQARQDADDLINTSIGNLNDLDTGDKSNLVGAINEVLVTNTMWIDVTNHGVVNDGVTDCTTALQTLIDATDSGVLYFPQGEYLISSITLPARKISILGDTNFNTVFKCAADNVSLIIDHDTFSGNTRSIEYITINGNGKTGVKCFDFYRVRYRYIANIHFINCYDGFYVDCSRNLTIKDIYQVGDLHNEFTSSRKANNEYNWNTVVDGWLVDTNDNPTPHDAWFTLNGMICTQWSNIVTEGRLECIAFDIVGMNEGTFFNNIVVVCPTFGVRTQTADGVQPACVDLNNFSIDQPLEGGLIIDCWWFMANNFSCVNGSQRNNTESAIIINANSKDVYFNNVISYNMNYPTFNVGAAERVFISNSSAKSGVIGGAAYVCPTQEFNNPKLINNDFETVNVPALNGVNNSGNHTNTIRSEGVIAIDNLIVGATLDYMAMPASVYNNCNKIIVKFQLNPTDPFLGIINIGGNNPIILPSIAGGDRCAIEIDMAKTNGEWYGTTTIINNGTTSVASGNVVSGTTPSILIAANSDTGSLHIVNYIVEVA